MRSSHAPEVLGGARPGGVRITTERGREAHLRQGHWGDSKETAFGSSPCFLLGPAAPPQTHLLVQITCVLTVKATGFTISLEFPGPVDNTEGVTGWGCWEHVPDP